MRGDQDFACRACGWLDMEWDEAAGSLRCPDCGRTQDEGDALRQERPEYTREMYLQDRAARERRIS